MQEHPLGVAAIVRHAERMHGRKTITTRTRRGLVTASFSETIARARRLASVLRSLGVGPGDRVATFSWNHQQHLEAYVAVPCMGAVLHTLNIRLFEADLAYIVEHAQDKVVIVDRSLWPQWERVAARVSCIRATIVVDDEPESPCLPGTLDYEELLSAHPETASFPDVPESHAAAMCYTSGTTGHPKGVVYSHRSTHLHTCMLGTVDALGICERDTVLAIVPMFHANAWGLPYGCLMWGADLVLPGRFMAPEALTELVVQRKVTFASGVPTIWLGMLEPLRKAKEQVRLSRIACAGSAVPPTLQRSYERELGVPIVHAWGMTETSPLVTFSKPLASHGDVSPEALERVLEKQGRAAPGVEIRIVGDDGREAPWDGKAVGEIQVRGNWIAASYYRDESSSQKFQDGWLRTGDVATIDPDGYVHLADRTKDLVKSGGEWISSVVLEGLIMGHPSVAEAAVIAVPHPRWSERPLACVVVRKGAALSKDDVIEFLRDKVAKWWLPDDVVFIEEVPKTSVGKFDKKVLRERFKDHRSS
ncbi:long-chain fatty acid--CoA ligase [bacterium]|nr:long-chain fatty acid--CoA ligase [bacterium]